MPTPVINTWNPDENFWVLNPIFKTVKIFRDLHDKDKSKGKAHSSKLMWAIALYCDVNEKNIFRNLNEQDRQILISTDYLQDPKFNWEHPEILDYIFSYQQFALSSAERELIEFERKLAQRTKFIMSTDYTLDYYEESESGKKVTKKGTADQLDKMMLNSSKIYDQLKEIQNKIAQEKTEGKGRGGAVESLSETGEI